MHRKSRKFQPKTATHAVESRAVSHKYSSTSVYCYSTCNAVLTADTITEGLRTSPVLPSPNLSPPF